MTHPWTRFLTDRDREVFALAGYGRREDLGSRPAILVVDVTVGFVGDRREPLLAAVERFPNACGEQAWDAVAVISSLLERAREHHVPVIYTRNDDEHLWLRRQAWGRKVSLATTKLEGEAARADDDIVTALAPRGEDIVIRKTRPSAFFATPLLTYLTALGIDQLIVSGGTTSGCIRATVVDAFSHGYPVAVVEDAVFDRGEASHALSLFDMEQKYAEVVCAEDVAVYFDQFHDD